MNNENTIAIKKVLEEACGGTSGPGDRGWEAEGVERMFFDEYGAEGFCGGCVEVRHGERNGESVRLELELAPALAARVIALVTNTTLGEMPALNDLERRAIDSLAIPAAPEENTGGEPEAARIMRDERHGYTAAISTKAEEILARRKERELEKESAAEQKALSEGTPDELDFEVPEAPL